MNNYLKPIIFPGDKVNIDEVKRKYEIVEIVDSLKEMLFDLFLSRNPKYKFNKNYQNDFDEFIEEYRKGKQLEKCGNWIYFPWNKYLIHCLENDLYQELRTSRNRNFITLEEQKKFYDFKIGVMGLSVGSNIVLTIALMGGCRYMKLADGDILLPSNLNRVRLSIADIGKNKAELVASYIYQIDPYSDIEIWSKGVTKDNLEKFLEGIDLLIEEADDIEIKIQSRELAKNKKIPVIMITDDGDDIIVDIERYDLNPNQPIFHGVLDGFDYTDIKTNPKKLFQAMAKIIDISLINIKMLKVPLEIGKTIYSWPQLASASSLAGGVGAYLVREIALGKKIKNGKFKISLEKIFDEDFENNEKLRNKIIKEISNFFGLN